MNDDERTILDTSLSEDNTRVDANNSAASETPQAQKKEMSWAEKAAYAGGGAVLGAGIAVGGQAMAGPSSEIPPEAPAVPEAEANEPAATEEAAPAPDPEDAIVATATGIRVAQVNDDLSFSQAFAEARNQVGPGGIFEWHGRVYGTYYKDEWDAMTPAERHEYQANIDYTDVISNDTPAPHHNDVAHHTSHTSHTSQHPTHHGDPQDTPQEPQHDDIQTVDDDVEVHVLEVGYTDLNGDGIPEDAAIIEENGVEILVVDIDGDGEVDIVAADVDGDGELEYGDVSGQGYEMPASDGSDIYYTQNDTPDYMNDADVGNYMA